MQAIARTPLQLGNSIRERRRELGLTQEQLAAKAGLRQRTISDIERSAAARFDTVRRALAAHQGFTPRHGEAPLIPRRISHDRLRSLSPQSSCRSTSTPDFGAISFQ